MVCDHDTATTCWLLGVNAVLDAETCLLDGVVEDGGVFVVADTAEVDGGVGWEEVLGAASGVLGSAAGDQFGGVVVEELFVDAEMFGGGEDGIIGFEVVLLEKFTDAVALSLDVCGLLASAMLRRWRESDVNSVMAAMQVLNCRYLPSSGFSKQRSAYS